MNTTTINITATTATIVMVTTIITVTATTIVGATVIIATTTQPQPLSLLPPLLPLYPNHHTLLLAPPPYPTIFAAGTGTIALTTSPIFSLYTYITSTLNFFTAFHSHNTSKNSVIKCSQLIILEAQQK